MNVFSISKIGSQTSLSIVSRPILIILICLYVSTGNPANTSEKDLESPVKEFLDTINLKNSLNTSVELRSDRFTDSKDSSLFFNPQHSRNYVVWISVESWAKYLMFKQETCRNNSEERPDFSNDDFMTSGYFQWESNNFHRQLRIK